jgi:hypothetical protein
LALFALAEGARFERPLAFGRTFDMVCRHIHSMNVRNANVRAMIIGMIIISRRPGRGHIA